MKRVAFVLALAWASAGCNNKPTGFGINVEARTAMLASGVRSQIVSARLIVSGDESFTSTIPNVGKAAQSGAMKFRYIPGIHSGTLTIRVDGLGGDGSVVAGGTAPPVTVVDGKSVDAVLTMATGALGGACQAATDCMSGNCADGVCCDTPCTGVCESCNQTGSPGVCTPAASGTDPDNDCFAKMPMVNGGNADGGADNPDGGINDVMLDPQACSGTCDGNRACKYPGTETSCGSSFCSDVASLGNFVCDGNGTCTEADSMCTDYNCDSGSCKTSCTTNADCQDTDFCDVNTQKCVPKHILGANCMNNFECTSSFCASGVCCDNACNDQGQSCNNNGSVGHCQCTGHPCPSGVSCALFYRDADVDGFGDKTGTIANGKAVVGCVGDPPAMHPGFVPDNRDCDDGDAMANPNQTGYFDHTTATVHTFDWNCDGDPNGPEYETPEIIGGTCEFCATTSNLLCTRNPTCGTANASSAFSCGVTRAGIGFCLCCVTVSQAFTSAVACGATGTRTNCGTCSAVGNGPTNTFTFNVVQRCH